MNKLRWALAVTLLMAAVLWNGWVLGWLNHGTAGYLHMSISELEVAGQPYATLFDMFENISGALMIVSAFGFIVTRSRSFILFLILISIASIGGLTIYDVAHPLDCNTYQNDPCVSKINTGKISHREQLHGTESLLTAYTTILLSVLILVWTYTEKASQTELVVAAFLVAGILIALAILDVSSDVPVNAVFERLWNVLVSIDIGFVAVRLLLAMPQITS